jgi:hypothetical protein
MSEEDSSIVSFTSLKNIQGDKPKKDIKGEVSSSSAVEKFTKILDEAFGSLNAENGRMVSREANKIKSLAWLTSHAARNRPSSLIRIVECLDSFCVAMEIAGESAALILNAVHGDSDGA